MNIRSASWTLLVEFVLTLHAGPAASQMCVASATGAHTQICSLPYAAYDGKARNAYVLFPASYLPDRGRPLPLIISPHGRGLDGLANAKLWGDLPGLGGFAVVCPDGTRFSWGDPRAIADLARMPGVIGRGLAWLPLDSGRIYAAGGSMGGQEALLLLARYPKLLAGAIAVDSAVDLALRYEDFPLLNASCDDICRRNWGGPVGDVLAAISRRELGGTPQTAPAAYAERSPISYARQIAESGVPLELWWSRTDEIIAHSDRQSGRLFDAVKAANPHAPVTAFTGSWKHTSVLDAERLLPQMLARFGLLPDSALALPAWVAETPLSSPTARAYRPGNEAERAICGGKSLCTAGQQAELERESTRYATSRLAQVKRLSCAAPELLISTATDVRQAWRETSARLAGLAGARRVTPERFIENGLAQAKACAKSAPAAGKRPPGAGALTGPGGGGLGGVSTTGAAKPRTTADLRAFFQSSRYAALRRSNEEFLMDVYRLVLGRPHDPQGLRDWLAAMKGKKALSRRDVVEGFLKSAEYKGRLAARPKPQTKPETPPRPSEDPLRNPGNVVFDGVGLFVAEGGRCTAAACGPTGQLNAAALKAAGVTWIALQINNRVPVEKNTKLLPGWADEWRAAGLAVGFWGVSYGQGAAAHDAEMAADLSARYHADFYIADAEGPFQAGEGDTGQNRAFVEAFQAEASAKGIGKIARALSSMGRVALNEGMKAWIDGGWDSLPQAYWNDYLVYQPSKCVQFYRDWGWPASRIHPTIATYPHTGDQTRILQLNDYAADLRASGAKGFSIFLPENYLDGAEYRQLIALTGK